MMLIFHADAAILCCHVIDDIYAITRQRRRLLPAAATCLLLRARCHAAAAIFHTPRYAMPCVFIDARWLLFRYA